MNKKIIKSYLSKTFIKEENTPGISVTDKAKKESEKINNAGLKAYSKEVKAKEDKDTSKMAKNKFVYDDKFQKTYHDEMEIMNGQEMLQYDAKPDADFTKRAKEGIEGSSKMGNEGKIGNAEAAWDASSDDFGKELVKRIKSSEKKRNKETPTLNLRGRDIQADLKDTGHRPYAIEENIHNTAQMGGVTSSKGTAGYVNNTSKMDKDYSDSIRKQAPKITPDDKKPVKEIESGLGKSVPPSEEKEKYITNFAAGSPEEAEFRKRYKKQDDILNRNIQYLKDKKQGVTEIAAPKKPLSEKGVNLLTSWVTSLGAKEAAVKLINQLSQTGMVSDFPDTMEYGSGLNRITSLLEKGDYNNAYHTAKALSIKLEKKAMRDMMGESEEIEENQSKVAAAADKKVQKDKTKNFNDGEDHEKVSREVEYGINNNDNKPKIKESMKRLNFKTNFNGLGNALRLIPEGYRVDKKEFEMTDGNETYRIRWEGNLKEGNAVVLTANDKTLVNEDIQRMKALFGYKSQDTLGTVKGNARIDENKIFGDIWNKSKVLLGESEDMEGVKATEGNWEDKTKKAPEATKHVEGSVSKDKGTQAPKAKEGNPDGAKKQAPEAKENISTKKASMPTTAKPKEGNWEDVTGGEKMFDGVAPKPKEGHWEDNVPSQAADAKKHVHLKESEEEELWEAFDEEGETEEAPEKSDNWNKPEDDDSSSEAEPSMGDIGGEEPSMGGDDAEEDAISVPTPNAKGGAQLLFSPSTGKYWIKGTGLPLAGMEVPSQFLEIASDKTKKSSVKASIILKKIEDMEMEPEMSDDDSEL